MHSISLFIKRQLTQHSVFIIALILLSLLLARNPFSQRTIIANLEPYPDSFHYIDPAMTFLTGKGFFIEREGRLTEPSVPPLYSFVLSLIYIVIHDVRAFYFVNVFLSFLSLFLFYLVTIKLFPHRSIQLIVLILYATNYPIHWFPTLAMAENLLLPLYIGAIGLLLYKTGWKNSCLAGVISIAFYATKYASLPLSCIFPLLYLSKIAIEHSSDFTTLLKSQHKNKKIFENLIQTQLFVHGVVFFVSLFITSGLYLLYELIVKENNVIGGLVSLTFSVFFPKPVVQTGQASTTHEFFSTTFITTNVTAYLRWLLGFPIQTLWKQFVILPKILAIPAVGGLIGSLFTTRYRFIALSLLLFLASVIVFMMVFYAYDGRYFIIAVPTVILGFGLFLTQVSTFITHTLTHRIVPILAFCFLAIYFFVIGSQLKFWIGLNIKYAETPWYYISIITFDNYLRDHRTEYSKPPVIISALPPYLIDYYAKEKFIILPLNKSQEFRSRLKEAWGDYDFQDLEKLYTKFLLEGHAVYLTQYGLGNEGYLQESYAHVLSSFHSTKVVSGCYHLCDMYELSIQKNPKKSLPTPMEVLR